MRSNFTKTAFDFEQVLVNAEHVHEICPTPQNLAWRANEPLLFEGDDAPHSPNIGWVLACRGTQEVRYAQTRLSRRNNFREWAYMLWDEAQINSKAFETLKTSLEDQ